MTAPTLPSWLNKGQPKATWPDWLLMHVVGRPEANGSFMIRTMLGSEKVQARVLPGNLVVERNGIALTRPPGEMRALLAELDEKEAGAYALLNAADRAHRGVKPRAERDIADLRDDTDDITYRIRAASAGAVLTGEESGQKASIPAAPKPVSAPKEITRPAPAPPVKLAGKAVPAKGSMPSIEWIQLDRLLVDDSYQRSIDTGPSRALIARIGREWDWRLCVPLMVSRRAGGLFVIDGQHRLFGARLRKDVPQLPCCISVYDGPADEAAMFVAANRERRAMNRLDDFHAAQAGGDADALAVAALIESVGFTVSRKTGSASWVPGEVAFTSAIAKARRRYGEAIAQEALQLLADAFPGERLTVGSSIFSATVGLLADRPADFTRDRALAALRTFNMEGWGSFIAKAKGGSDRATALKEMLRAAYDDVGREKAA